MKKLQTHKIKRLIMKRLCRNRWRSGSMFKEKGVMDMFLSKIVNTQYILDSKKLYDEHDTFMKEYYERTPDPNMILRRSNERKEI